MVVLEAWAAGVPVLMTEACNLAEGFTAGAAIRIGEDVPGIVEGLVAAFAMGDTARAMGERGRALVTDRFSEAAFTRRMIGLYESVLHG
jgi:glycosyltransferase involved in cell wall biosynthesis